MMGARMIERVLSAVRKIRDLELDRPDLGETLLEILRAATNSTWAGLDDPEVRVGSIEDGAARIEQRFRARSGERIIALARPAPFEADDAMTLEILGGEVISRIEASGLRREIDLMRALSRAAVSAPLPLDVADRAASELLGALGEAQHVLVHMLTHDRLELIARRTTNGSSMGDAPPWAWVMPLDGPTLMALAAREKRAIERAIDEVEQPRRAFLEAQGIRHLLSVPLLARGDVMGVLTVGHRQNAPWNADSRRLVDDLAARLGVELARARVLETERRGAEDLGLVNEVGGLVAQHLELRAVLSTAATTLARVVAVSRVDVCLFDASRASLRGVASTIDGVVDFEIPLDGNAVAHAFRTGAPVRIEDAETDERTDKNFVSRIGSRSLMVVPLIAGGNVLGVIVLVETRHKRRFTDAELARVVAVANVLAPTVTNAKMFEDLRRSYEALAKAQADLVMHERLAALGELSAVIAHEVRNPVAIIFNSLAELRRVAPDAPSATMLLDIVAEETSRLNRIVRDLLDFVRPYHAHPRPVTIESLVHGSVDAARRSAPDTSAIILTSIATPSRQIVVDETMLQQALLNLIVNALQATPAGKRVTVSAEVVDDGDVARLRCEVADEGVGLDATEATRLFQPFFTTKPTGTGLGLAIVRRLTDALGGTIVVQSRETGGAMFTLTVPLSA
jgi:two-component system, NtrC family, sensor histidine kinase HydH